MSRKKTNPGYTPASKSAPSALSPPAAPARALRWSLIGLAAAGIGLSLYVSATMRDSTHLRPQSTPAHAAPAAGSQPAAGAASAPASRPAARTEAAEQAEMEARAERFRNTLRRGAWAATKPAAARPRDARPAPDVNVVIFLIDTLRADRVGAYGYRNRPTTPTIDQLATEGVRFENAYSAAPWTLPSVSSLFTATCACRHNTISRRTKLGPKLETLAEALDRCGYDTYSIYANRFLGNSYGLARGFDFFASSPRNDGMKIGTALGPAPHTPFFLYVHNLEPHNPYHFAPPHTEGFRDVDAETRARMKKEYETWKKCVEHDFRNKQLPGTTDRTEELDAHIAALNALRDDYSELYDASIRLADRTMASVIDRLRKDGLWDKTLFIVLSDHGEEFGEHGGWLHDQSVYEEMLRIPMIVRFPGGQFAGRVVDDPVSLIDVLPTVMDYIERADLVDADVQGRSLMPSIRGQAVPADEPVVVGMRVNVTNYYKRWRDARGDLNIAMRLGRWKGIWNAQPDNFELYDLSTDRGEQHNLAAEHPDIVTRLREHARAWLDQCRSRAREAQELGELDEETRSSLNAIGYVD